jgi:hypothetical protein
MRLSSNTVQVPADCCLSCCQAARSEPTTSEFPGPTLTTRKQKPAVTNCPERGRTPTRVSRPEDEAASLLRDGLPPLHAFGQEPCSLGDVEDRVDRVLKEWDELSEIPQGTGRVVGFRDREARPPRRPARRTGES